LSPISGCRFYFQFFFIGNCNFIESRCCAESVSFFFSLVSRIQALAHTHQISEVLIILATKTPGMSNQQIIDEIGKYFRSTMFLLTNQPSDGHISVHQPEKTIKLDIVNTVPPKAEKFYKINSLDDACEILTSISNGTPEQCKKVITTFIDSQNIDVSKDLYIVPFLAPTNREE